MPMPAPTFSEDPIGALRAFVHIRSSCGIEGDLVISSEKVRFIALSCIFSMVFGSFVLLCLIGISRSQKGKQHKTMLICLIALTAFAVVIAAAGCAMVGTATPLVMPA